MEVDAVAPQTDLTLIGAIEPGEDVRERRLAGAVLTQQGMDFARSGFEVDVLVRNDGGETLRDAAQSDCRGWRGGAGLPAGTVNPWRYRSRL
jgi:hypothetical protein